MSSARGGRRHRRCVPRHRPEHQQVRRYDGASRARARSRELVVQEQRGTADGVAAVESFADGAHVLGLNSETTIRCTAARVRELGAAGLAVSSAKNGRLGNVESSVAPFSAFRSRRRQLGHHREADASTLASLGRRSRPHESGHSHLRSSVVPQHQARRAASWSYRRGADVVMSWHPVRALRFRAVSRPRAAETSPRWRTDSGCGASAVKDIGRSLRGGHVDREGSPGAPFTRCVELSAFGSADSSPGTTRSRQAHRYAGRAELLCAVERGSLGRPASTTQWSWTTPCAARP